MAMQKDFVLKNGLRVFVEESHAAPVVALQVWTNVGSGDETPKEAGMAHVIEHMIFKGTKKRGPGVIAREVENAGGEINAFTSFDQTVYHLTLASRHFDLGLDILSDVLHNSLFDAEELAMEKEVVLEELRGYLDVPSRQMTQSVFETVFKTHPYGRPVIGFEETVRAFGQEDLFSFFNRWYTPKNMVLVVVGDIDAEEVCAKVEAAFEGDNRPAPPERSRPKESAQTESRAVHLEKTVQEAHLELAFPLPPAEDPDAPLLDVLALILGQGESSRLVEQVKNRKQLVNAVYSYAYMPKEPGIQIVGATLQPESLLDAYVAMLEELQALRTAPIRASELRKAKSIVASERVYERETVEGRARKYGYYLQTFENLEQEKTYYRIVDEATVEDLQRVARATFTPERLTVGTLLPKGMEPPAQDLLFEKAREFLSDAQPAQAPAISLGARDGETTRIVLPNGIRLLVKENHAVPLVAIRGLFQGGLRFENKRNNGVFQLISQLMTRGTTHRSARAIAHEVESLAAGMGGLSGRNSFGLRAEFLSQHLERGMELFAELLHRPAFAEDELTKVKRITVEAIRNQADHPASLAFKNFQEKLYRRHPFRMQAQGTEESVSALKTQTLHKTYARYATAENFVLSVVGDVDPRDMEELATRYFSDFRPGMPDFPSIPEETPLSRTRKVIGYNDKQQLNIVLGWRSVALDHPDRHAIDLMASVLSGQGGRLFSELRDRQGLAYSVSPISIMALGEGFFAIYMGTEPSKFQRAHKGILKEIERFIRDGATEEEIRRNQKHLVGTYEIDLQRNTSLASNIGFNELYGLGYDSYREYPNRIQAVTAEQVLEVARKYLNPKVYVMSALGPLEEAKEK